MQMTCSVLKVHTGLFIEEALLGGSTLPAPFNILPRSPCSLQFFGARSFLPIFTAPFSSPFAPCSFLTFPLAP